MPTIIFKKTFKIKPSGFKIANEKSFSFHGASVTPQLVHAVNEKLRTLFYSPKSNRVMFQPDEIGHYTAKMNHDCQKYHEEDIIACVLDTMESLGWTFKFEYDSQSSSTKVSGDSFTARELFIFQK